MKKLLIANGIILAILLAVGMFFTGDLLLFIKSTMPKGITLTTLNPEEGFFTYFLVGTILALFVYIPICILSIYLWAKGALYEKEKDIIKKNVFLGIILFFIGTSFGACVYLFIGIPFFAWFNTSIGLTSNWSIAAFSGQMMFASLVTGILFMFPVVLNNLISFKLLDVKTLKKNRIPVALGLALVIIVLPFLPNNPLEQLAVFIPIYSLFELTILFNKQRNIKLVSNGVVI